LKLKLQVYTIQKEIIIRRIISKISYRFWIIEISLE
jgi:hypothetical protein